jgi:polyketide biosynthesis acyl carrier protein
VEDDGFNALIAALRGLMPELAGQAVARGDSLAALGVNSIDRAEILLLAMEAMQIDAPVSRFHGAANIGELADRLNAARHA